MSLVKANGAGEVSTGFYNGATSRSLRMQDARLTRTPSSTGDPKKWTFSAWLKRTSLGQSYIFAGSPLASGYDGIAAIYFNGSDQLHTYYDTSGSNPYGAVDDGSRVYRDLGSWYHLCWAVDAANTIHKIWINNVLVSTNTGRYPPNFTYGLNNAGDQMVIGDGSWDSYGSPNFNGYMAEINYLDGQYLEPDSFAETKNGVWIPLKDPSLTYGTNGFRLQFLATGTSADSSGIGADTSGQGNHYAVTSLAAGDVVLDNPENNFAIFNALTLVNNGSITEGNLKYTSASGWGGSQSTFAIPSSGKWYVEFRIGSNTSNTAQLQFGIQKSGVLNSYTVTGLYGFEINNGFFTYVNGTYSGYTSGKSAGDILQMAIDADNGKIYYGHNNTYYVNYNTTGGDPSGGNNPSASSLDFGATDFVIIVRSDRNNGVINFGQDGTFAGTETAQDNADANGNGNFYYAPPTDFLALCSANLPDPTIGPQANTQADDHFNTVLYTGNATDTNITGVGFQPDWVWVKNRSNAYHHALVDSSRGATKVLKSSDTSLEGTFSEQITGFLADGFSVGDNSDSGNYVNINSHTYVAWNWKANGGTTTTNDASSTGIGTIDSVFQANDTSGFSIVTYTGTGSAGTVRHGLSVAPSLVIIKSRTTASPSNWVIGQDQSGFTGQNYFTDISAFSPNSGSFNNTAPTSSVVSIGTDQTTNGNTATYVMYCFANVEGFSKIGSYEMNYNSNGPFINTGFRPAWLLTRPVDQNGNWSIYDSVRDPLNDGDANMVFAGSIGTESGFAASAVDFVSNGFKIRHSSDGYSNIASNTAIYMAFAEQPFKFSNAR